MRYPFKFSKYIRCCQQYGILRNIVLLSSIGLIAACVRSETCPTAIGSTITRKVSYPQYQAVRTKQQINLSLTDQARFRRNYRIYHSWPLSEQGFVAVSDTNYHLMADLHRQGYTNFDFVTRGRGADSLRINFIFQTNSNLTLDRGVTLGGLGRGTPGSFFFVADPVSGITFRQTVAAGQKSKPRSHPKPHALGLLVEEPLHGQAVAFQPEAADAAHAVAAQQALLAEIFAGVQITQVHLHHGRVDGGHGISQDHAGVGEPAGIQHDAVVAEAYFVQLVQYRTFVVGLKVRELQVREGFLQLGEKVVERAVAVDAGLAAAEQVKVGAVENENVHA